MKIRRVGSILEKHVDVRVISSINKEYRRPVPKDTLRKDLYYRLSVVFIEVPPLRVRKEDIDILAYYFIQKYNLVLGKMVKSIAPDVLELFIHYDWPGNVRELEHVIEGSLNIVDTEQELQIDHLPANFFISDSLPESETSPKKNSYTLFPINNKDHLLNGLGRLKSSDTELDFQEHINLTAAQNRREIEMIYHALRDTKGNISQAARQLGVSRQLLHYKLKKYNITPKEFKQ
jgi:arginine utilization regulatory protein